ncbi:hypothetical protein FHX57_006336 [Paraburkholderia tropica]|uniref:hypothetical protein n=1 Tax=Paraburkholderia tropica TaxID=92647 RepID=UPI00161966B1|nr:hypothetical protein [Paraburkholderia tropica]MBB3003957.1 hypothetical protein [Paraburkholderia tropica]MBB6323449.1 hypothetical protein [Paraburkholderia tropica]
MGNDNQSIRPKVTFSYSDDKGVLQKAFSSGLKAAPNLVANKVAEGLTSVKASFIEGQTGKIIAGAFKAAGTPSHTADVVGNVGKLAILTLHFGAAGAAYGLVDVVFSMFAWIDAEDENARQARWLEIEESIQAKYDEILRLADEKKAALANQFQDIDTKFEQEEAFYIAGKAVTKGEILTLRAVLNDGSTDDILLAQAARQVKSILDDISTRGNNATSDELGQIKSVLDEVVAETNIEKSIANSTEPSIKTDYFGQNISDTNGSGKDGVKSEDPTIPDEYDAYKDNGDKRGVARVDVDSAPHSGLDHLKGGKK